MAGFWGNAVYRRLKPNEHQRVAEIGVFDGQNSAWLLARLPKLTLYMVDQWTPYQDSVQPDTAYDAGKWDRVRRMALARTDFAEERRKVVHAQSHEAAKEVPNGSLDMAFIDANHSYEYVKRDIAAWWPKVKPMGFLAGHDWEKKEPRKYGVVQAVQEFAASIGMSAWVQLDEDATWFIRKVMEAGPGQPETPEDYAKLIRDRTHFAQANYGDGEWACLMDREGTNCDGTTYTPELAAALRETLLEPCGMWCGTNPGNPETKPLRAQAEAWVVANKVNVPWRKKEILPSANVNGELRPFLDAVRTRRVIVVGPEHLKHLPPHVIGPHTLIQVPNETAWKVVDQTVKRVLDVIRPDDLVLFASGMATNLAIHKLWPGLRDTVTLLDVGALLDPYVGVYSRNGYRKESFQTVGIKKNLGRA